MSPRTQLVCLSLAALLLAGCGGGGGDPAFSGTPPGASAFVADCVAGERPVGRAGIAFETAFEGLSFSSPMALIQDPADATRWLVAERAGRVRRIDAPASIAPSATTVLDISSAVDTRSEGGLLGLALHPDFPATREAFLSYTTTGSPLTSRVSRFAVAADLRLSGEEILFSLAQPFANHNGGWIAFGPDGYLYIGLGDGGSGGDPLDAGQDLDTLLGSMLRIDVDATPDPGKAYAVPNDNPFAPGGARPGEGAVENYAWGLRNPWRFSFDRLSGALWLGDVGQGAREEVDKIVAGGNYGWRCYEGNLPYNLSGCGDPSSYLPPQAEYPHSDGNCAVTGGYVYRGAAIPSLVGTYIYGDYCSGRVWGLADGAASQPVELDDTERLIASFAEDSAGELYLLDLGGRIERIVAGGSGPTEPVPTRLSQTGCAEAGDPTLPSARLTEYVVNAPFWSDGADKARWFSLPAGADIAIEADLDWTLPIGSVVRKDFRLGARLIETRLFMRHSDGEWAGYSFEWNDAQTEAFLLTAGKDVDLGGQTWSFPSPNACLACHTVAAGRSLGLETAQLNGPGAAAANQLETLDTAGLFADPLPDLPAALPRLENPYGVGDLTARARAYLHTNCAQCHRPGGPTPVGGLDLRFDTPFADMGLCDEPPQAGALGIVDARLLAPGDPARSVLVARVSRRDEAGMPPLASQLVDNLGAALLTDWVSNTSACP